MASIQLATADKDAAAKIAARDAVWCAGIDAYDAWIAARDATFARPNGAVEWPAIRDAVVAKNQTEWRDRVAAITLKNLDADAANKHEDFSNKGKYHTEYEKALNVWTERCREASKKNYDNKAVHERYGMDGYTHGDEREDDYDYDYDYDDC